MPSYTILIFAMLINGNYQYMYIIHVLALTLNVTL